MNRKAQKSRQLELPQESRGEAPRVERSVQRTSAVVDEQDPAMDSLMERIVERSNAQRAWKRVKRNGGSPGIDGVTVEEGPAWLREHWPRIREELLAGTYQPQLVRRATIPKRGGGERHLGIPTVVDRLIQQAVLQVLQPDIDPTFSEHSYGFRPRRGAHGAIAEAQRHVQDGKTWVVDVDLEKFFDRVNHDVLMGRLARRISDERVLRLCRRYLEAGVLADGVALERHEGTPQGGPLSPLLANVLLDEVDKELEQRGHAFVRYADDLRVFMGSKKAGQRVMSSLVRLFGKLRLRVNESKSAVDRAWNRSFLGFSFWVGRERAIRTRISGESIKAMKARVRQLTSRQCGRSMEEVASELRAYLLGWRGYYGRAQTPNVLRMLDKWIRHRLRAIQLKQWKRGKTVFRELIARGLSRSAAAKVAGNTRRWWHNSAMAMHMALPNRYFHELGLPSLAP